VKDFKHIIHKSDRWKYVKLNPTAPTIGGLVKVHKEGAPVRSIINWKNALANKVAKMLVKKIHIYVPYLHV
jgi:hypothetical protein